MTQSTTSKTVLEFAPSNLVAPGLCQSFKVDHSNYRLAVAQDGLSRREIHTDKHFIRFWQQPIRTRSENMHFPATNLTKDGA
jgi:hypothetical protein